MRTERGNTNAIRLILIIVLFVGLVAAKSWALLEQGRLRSDDGAGSEPALVETTISGRLEIDLADAASRLAAVRAAYESPEAAATIESLVRRQVFTSYLQTIFRAPAMPLPADAMTVELGERSFDVRRARIVIPYVLRGHIVAPSESLLESVPDLADIDAEYAETLIVPADPRNLFQRLGYACANQDEIPLGMVDDGNYGNYFDPTCAPGVPVCEHPDGVALEPCLDVLSRENGVSALVVRMKRIAYDADLAAQVSSGPVRTSGGADLTVDAAKLAEHDIIYRNFSPDSCAIAEGCVGGPGVRRLLRFRAVTPNIGDQDVAFGDIDHLIEDTNQFVWSDCHEHYHFNGYGIFSLEKDERPLLPGTKQSFCVESTGRARNAADTAFTAPYQTCDNQGIVAGWEDEYFAGLDCQWIDITDLPIAGESETFSLAMEVNPQKLLCEGEADPDNYVPALDDQGIPILGPGGEPALKQSCRVKPGAYDNNKVAVDVVIPKVGGAVTAPCDIIEAGPLRNCGWALNAAGTCEAGKPVRAAVRGEMIRACAWDGPCSHNDAIADAASPALTFTCPASGTYQLLVGPYLAKP